jgi:tetratricopeptide (TPR) repeat protein
MMVMAQVQNSLNSGFISAKGAQELLKTAEKILAGVTDRKRTPDVTALWAEASLMISDAYSDAGDKVSSARLVASALEMAEGLVRDDPKTPGFQHLLYRALYRSGDVAANARPADRRLAREHYDRALGIIETLAGAAGNYEWQKDAAYVYQLRGDSWQGEGKYPAALSDYERSVAIMEVVSGHDPNRFLWKRDLANSRHRVGQAWAGLREDEKALETYFAALSLRLDLHQKDPNNYIIQTNVAASHRAIGDLLLGRLRRLNDAAAAFKKEVAMRIIIASYEPFNTDKQVTLAQSCERAGRALEEQEGQGADALEFYRCGRNVWNRLSTFDPGNQRWRERLAAIEDKIKGLKVE